MDRGSQARLSARERDCLELIGDGLGAKGVAVELGISVHTVEKHLAAARRKLGVSKTVEALKHVAMPSRASGCVLNERFADSCSACARDGAEHILASRTKAEAWSRLRSLLAARGFDRILLGMVAEPFGEMSNGARVVDNALNPAVKALFDVAGMENADPVARRIAMSSAPFFTDSRQHLSAFMARFPGRKTETVERLMDSHAWRHLNVPMRDTATGAPYGLTLQTRSSGVRPAEENLPALIDNIRLWSGAYWSFIRTRGHLARLCGLTPRQTEVLRFSARGFRMVETAERMGVSPGVAEKILRAARDRLGARTTPAAIFRATVYAAL